MLPKPIFSSAFNTLFITLFLLLLPSQRSFIENGENDSSDEKCGKSFTVAAADDEADAEAKLKSLFIADLKKLLTHNQVFYNTYGHKDEEVDLAFDEARIAADVIYLYPEIFRVKVQNINYQINEAAKNAKEEEEKAMMTTADGV